MLRYVASRLATAVVTVLGIVVITFLLLRALPGDPALAILGDASTPEAIENLRRVLGLDQPMWKQFLDYVGGLLTGDLGTSQTTKLPVATMIAGVLWPSLILALTATALAVLVGVPAGIVSAIRNGTATDSSIMVAVLALISIPQFWLGLSAILLFSFYLGWLPSISSTSGGFIDDAKGLILPAAVLSTAPMAYIARLTRSSMLEVLNQDYIRTARAMGVQPGTIVMKYALRNAAAPIVAVVAVGFALAVGSSILIETVFSRRGLGTALTSAVFSRDYVTVQGIVLVLALIVVIMNVLLDIVYPFIDPRLRRRK